jgi:hypothetical protein
VAEYTEAEARAWIEKHGVVNVGHTRRDVAGKREMLATWDTLVAERDQWKRNYDGVAEAKSLVQAELLRACDANDKLVASGMRCGQGTWYSATAPTTCARRCGDALWKFNYLLEHVALGPTKANLYTSDTVAQVERILAWLDRTEPTP